MGGHVIGTLDRVHERLILGHDPIEARFEIGSHIRIGILVDGQAGGGVLKKDMDQTHPNFGQIAEGLLHTFGDQMKTSGLWRQAESALRPVHRILASEGIELEGSAIYPLIRKQSPRRIIECRGIRRRSGVVGRAL